jgi:hypothetical protein
MHDRREKIVALVCRELVESLNIILSEAISEHYSQAAWEKITQAAAEDLSQRMMASAALEDLACGGDITSPRGKVNAKGIIEAVKQLAETAGDNPGKQAKIKHLAQHMQLVLGV